MKIFTLTSALIVAASAAFAHPVAFVAPAAPEMIIEETGSMGGSGYWLIPLLLIALVLLVAQDDPNPKSEAKNFKPLPE